MRCQCIIYFTIVLLGLVLYPVSTKIPTSERASPNFVYILTDDQDLMLNGLIAMKKSLSLIGDRGKFFEHAYVNTPLCCPSRSSILTGKYPHNMGVVNNSLSGNCSSLYWQKYHEPHSVAAILKNRANYTTFYAGKYLNQYGSRYTGGTAYVPKGYDWWVGLKGNSKYYNYTLSINGTNLPVKNLYLTDLLANYSLAFLNQRFIETSPFFMMVAPPASHSPFIPPKRYANKFPGASVVKNPSFNHTPHNKHWIVKMPPKRLPNNITILNQIHRRRLQTLLAVDDLVERIVLQLKKLKIFHKTYFIINSDNGFHIGQFGQPWDKRQPYEADTRVPLLISGPGVGKKILEPYPVSAVDIAPTILDLAGIKPPHHMDGKSFKKQLLNKRNNIGYKFVFMEYWGEGAATDKSVDKSCPWGFDTNVTECSSNQWCKCQDSRNNTYTCVVEFKDELRFKFCRFADRERFVEAYNLFLDPYELKNVYPRMNSKQVRYYNNVLNKFKKCSGRSCKKL
ncbi:N-acetylglucosamine-6-sulfatase-like isoform X1 [Euwallacea fornicatus]|uniref:N-acetylglucosamine-6-sulfatase-like isoform X1 n=2 Tax=Euwallacea fornicatus TaxID=995702 RepID=UPI003390465F